MTHPIQERAEKAMCDYADSLRQQARWIREALASAEAGGCELRDVDVDELDAAADELSRLTAELAQAKARWSEENSIVDRIWDMLGRPSFEELRGRSIYDLVDELKDETDRLTTENKAMREATIEECAKVVTSMEIRETNFAYRGGFIDALNKIAARIRALSLDTTKTTDSDVVTNCGFALYGPPAICTCGKCVGTNNLTARDE